MIRFTLTGLSIVEYFVEEFHEGWAWTNSEGEESRRCYYTPLEAQQNAINHEYNKLIEAEEAEEEAENTRLYGTESDQLHRYYNATRL